MSNTKSRLLIAIPSAAIFYAYAALYYLGESNMESAQFAASGMIFKPFVFRALTPWLARAFMSLGLSVDWAVVLTMVIFGVAFALALRELLQTFYIMRYPEIAVLIGVGGFVLAFGYGRNIYDTATAFFFTAYITALARNKPRVAMVLFIFATLNRETSILLLVVFALYYGARLSLRDREIAGLFIFQIGIFFALQGLIRLHFADSLGSPAWLRPEHNIQEFTVRPWLTLVHLWIGMGVAALISVYWDDKPALIRESFIRLAPIFLVLYIGLGESFEYRFFIELYPLAFALIVPVLSGAKGIGAYYPHGESA